MTKEYFLNFELNCVCVHVCVLRQRWLKFRKRTKENTSR